MSLFLHQIWRNVASHQCLTNGSLQWMGAVRMRANKNNNPHHSSPSVNIWRRQKLCVCKKQILKTILTLNRCFRLKHESIIHKNSKKVIWSRVKSAQIKHHLQAKAALHKCERDNRRWTFSLEEAILCFMDSFSIHKQWFKKLKTLIDGYVS